MQLRNIRPFSQHKPGDTVEVPDGAAFDPFHWEAAGVPERDVQVIPDPAPPVTLSAVPVSQAPVFPAAAATPKEM